jgi:peptidoglycan/xylan/chitin deacetylase (PgdA/CDA1 family)
MAQVILIFLLVFGCAFLPQARTNAPSRAMAITIDDLPYVDPAQRPYMPNARRATDDILRALKSHHAPAIGFVNEGSLQAAGEVEARTALLKQWVNAGMTLGNHTYSHADFNAMTVEQFQDEITRGETVTRKLMEPRKPYQLYFRHPMTRTATRKRRKRRSRNSSPGVAIASRLTRSKTATSSSTSLTPARGATRTRLCRNGCAKPIWITLSRRPNSPNA